MKILPRRKERILEGTEKKIVDHNFTRNSALSALNVPPENIPSLSSQTSLSSVVTLPFFKPL